MHVCVVWKERRAERWLAGGKPHARSGNKVATNAVNNVTRV